MPIRDQLPIEVRQRFRDRDPDALTAAYDRYERAVWSVAVQVCRSDALAQEAVQDTFVRAWQAADRYDPERDLAPWLFTIARRAAQDIARHERRPTRGGHEPEQDAVVEDPGIDEAWTAWQVQEAVRRLPAEEAVVVMLTFFHGLSQSQVAERIGLPLGTVKSRSHRAHRKLAEMLAHLREELPDDGVNRAPPPGRTPGQTEPRTERRAQT